MAKARMTDLSDLLGAKKAVEAAPTPEPESVPKQESSASDKATSATTNMSTAPREGSAESNISTLKASTSTPLRTAGLGGSTPNTSGAAATAGMPRYLTLMRKEARITPTQADDLSRLVRALNRIRQGQGERITDNTLIRVAIGLLMERVDDLRGITEAELFQSLGLEPAE